MRSVVSLVLLGPALAFACLFDGSVWAEEPVVKKAAKPRTANKKPQAAEIDPLDWTDWRGPEGNNISRETGLVDTWDHRGDGENLLWKQPAIGTRSTPIVMHGKLYMVAPDKPDSPVQGEKVVCLDAVTGDIVWENRFNVFSTEVPLERVGWTNCVGDAVAGRIYAMGVCGYFQCLDAETGETIWSRSLSEEFGLVSTYGGRTHTPILFEDLVIIGAVMVNWGATDTSVKYQAFDARAGGWGDMAKPAHRFLAMEKETGKIAWFNGTRLLPTDTTYSTPNLTVLDGQAALVFGSGDGGVYAMQPRTGNIIWKYSLSKRGLNVSPTVLDGTVYTNQGEENLDDNTSGAVVAFDGRGSGDISKTAELWQQKEIVAGRFAPLVLDGRMYTIDDGAGLWIFDTSTGEQVGAEGGRLRANEKLGVQMYGSCLYADGKIYGCEASGRFFILEPVADGVEVLHRLKLPSGEDCTSTPIVSHGRIYLTTSGGVYCIGEEGQEPAATERPEPPRETPADADADVAHVQVVPADVLLEPGQEQQYTVRLFNSRGQFLSEAEAEFQLDGPGKINAQGLFVADAGGTQQVAKVTATVGELSGNARIRVVPPLPWKFDFDDGQIPETWVGLRYRHVPLDMDLFDELADEDPITARLYIHVMTAFANAGRATVRFDDTLPLQSWTVLLRYLDLLQKATTPELAQAELDPLLDRLAKAGVIEKWDFAESPKTGFELVLERGSREIKGNGAMVKISTIPLGTTSQGWMGHTELSDYTIRADVRGNQRNAKIPDIGISAQRYGLVLLGEHQQLQIRSWAAEVARRRTATVPFTWEPHVWYTMKLEATMEGDKAVLRGKVWERGETEPTEWTVEMVDDAPNRVGSPGLFGNANDTEIFIDNLIVTPNK